MGYTPKEFARTLTGSFSTQTPFSVHAIDTNHWQVDLDSAQIAIQIKPLPPRIIAMLSLPVLQVRFTFSKMPKAQQEEFFRRFFQYFHKGGG